MFFLLATIAAQTQAANWETSPTPITSLKTGDIIAIVDGGSGRAMTNNNGTGSAPAATTFDPATAGLDNFEWEIVVGSDGNYQFKVPGTSNYLYCTNANNGVRVGTGTNKVFTLSTATNGNKYLYNTGYSRYVGVYNKQDWRCYTSTSNIGETNTEFYKKATATVAYTVTLGDDNTKLTETAAGAGVTLPSRNNVGDYTFVGWSTSNYTEESTNVPTTIAAGSYKPTANVTLYPMYKRTEGALEETASANSGLSASTTAKALESGKPITYKMSASNTYSDPLRIYKGNKLTIAGANISKIIITGNDSNNPATNLTCENGTSTDGNKITWTGSATNVVFTATDAQARVSSIEVTYSTGESTNYYISSPVAKELTSIAVTGTAEALWTGDDFSHEGITVTANYSDGSNANVTSDCTYSGYNMATAGNQTVTVTYGEKTATYNVTVNTIANTQETAYTAAQAKALIDAGKGLKTPVYVQGTVSEIVTAFSEQYGNITFNIEDGFQFYRNFKGADKEKWTSATEAPQVGDQVVGLGTLTKFSSTYEFAEGNYIVSMTKPTPVEKELTSIAITGTLTKTEYKVGEAFSTEGLTVTGTYSDASKAPITDGITWTVSPETFTATGTVNVTVTATVGKLTAEAQTFEVTVTEAPTPGTGDFTLVTSARDLVAGREYIIATSKEDGECKAMSTTQNTNNRGITDVTVSNGTIASNDNVQIITLESDDKGWNLNVGNGYLYASASNSNYLKTEDSKDANGNAKAAISINDAGAAKIQFQGNNTRNIIRYNSISSLISCYGSETQQPVYLYYREGVTPTPTVAAPVVNPESGLQTAGFKVTASCATTGAKIYYKYNDGEDTEYTTELDGQAGNYKFWSTLDVEGGETLTSEVVERTYTVKNLTGITLSGYYTALNVGEEFTFGGKVYALYEGSTDKVEVTKVAVFEREDFNKDVPGTYTITVSYTEGDNTQTASYDVKVVDEFNIIIAQPANGTLVVKNNATDDVVNSGDKLPVGTVLKVEATPATDYLYNFWQVYTDKHTITKYPGKETETYKLDAKNIKSEARAVFQANFREVETFTYSWYANGELVGTTNEGEDVTVPTAPAKLGDKGFMGWVTTSTVDPNNAPTYVDVYNLSSPTSNMKFYAVYATAPEEGVETGDYYEKVPSGYNDWTNGEYILVYEGGTYGSGTSRRTFGARAFNGEASGASITTPGNHAEVTITTKDGKSVVENAPSTVATITFSKPGSYMHMMSNKANYVYYNNGQTGSLAIDPGTDASLQREKKEYGYVITWNGDRCNVIVNGSNYLGFRTTNQTIETNDFRIGSSETTNAAIWFYKKVAGYSGFTTGVDAGKGEFKLVKSTDDLVNGREYIIVSKHDSGIYGLSIDDADSRQNTKYDDEGQEIPITEGKTSKDHRRAVKDVTLYNDDEYASINGLTSVLTLGGAAGAWKFNSAAGYLAMPKEDACLQLSATPSTAIVSVDEYSKSVVKFNATTNRYIFLNFNDGYPRFSTYGAGSNGWQYGKDVYLYYREALNEMTLGEIEANGIDGTQYTISDELEVVASTRHTAWVKDNAKSYAFRENTYGAQYFNKLSDYDQSNWIQLNLGDKVLDKRSILTGVKGTYNGYKDRKHELNNVTYTVVEGKTGSYSENLNTYTMGSFWNDNIYDYVVAETGKKFFFMNPKMMEVCKVTDAIWAGDNTFVVPKAGEEAIGDNGETILLNTGNFNGTFVIGDWSHNASSEKDVKAALNQDQYKGARYSFEIVVYKQDNDPNPNASAGAPAKVAGKTDMGKQTSYFMAIPLNMRVSHNIVTEVDDVNAAKSVKSVRYYNVAGHAFDEAQPGINIVVTEYTDGSHTAAKVLR